MDGGSNWVTQHSGTDTLFSIYFTSAQNGFAVANGGKIFKTNNAGLTWISQASISNQNLNDILFVDADTGYIVGNKGTILKTIDGGMNWRVQPTGLTANLTSISIPSAQIGYIGGWEYASAGNYKKAILLKTINGGGPTLTCTPVFITNSFGAINTCLGNTSTFTISAWGTPPFSYRWYKNGVLIDSTIATSSTTDNYTTPVLTNADTGHFVYCKITNQCLGGTSTTVSSDTIRLLRPQCIPVSAVYTNMGTVFVYLNSPNPIAGYATFTAYVTGTPPFTYSWYVNNNLQYTTTDTAKSQTFNYAANGATSYQIMCKISNCDGCISGTGGGTNAVYCYGILDANCPMATFTDPINQTKTTCQTATFSVPVYCTNCNDLEYSWYKNGTLVNSGSMSTFGSFPVISYTTPALTLADNGNTYTLHVGYCWDFIWGGGYWTSSPATLTVIQPVTISQQPVNQIIVPGNTATFLTTVAGPPPYSYSWYTNGVLSSSTLNTSSTSSSFTTPILNQTDFNNSYYCVVSNGAGCYTTTSDVVHLHCASFHSVALTGCDSVSLNNQTYTQSGDYVQVFPDSLGCDSILNIHVALLGINNSILQQLQDLSFQPGNAASFTTSVNGNPPFSYYWFKNGVVLDSLLASSDSSDTFNIPALSLVDIGSSYSCTVIFGGGCDTLYSDTAHLICTTSGAISPVACDSISINGQTYTSSGLYVQTLSNSWGCDSTLTINLTVTNIIDSILQNGSTLSSSISGATYQWVDCENGFAAIAGATNQSFAPIVNGYYALIISKGLCVDTSACYNVNSVGINKLDFEEGITIFPSPVKNILQIASTSMLINEIKLYNSIGALLIEQKQNKKQVSIDLSSHANGIYFVEIKTEKGHIRKKVVKE
ncbi:MAG: immunoglobulin domain-containing protein [Bacteroidetes bacterium]|nr:immunoglobulin domain-containing protein [Bacteroidota bacterium]